VKLGKAVVALGAMTIARSPFRLSVLIRNATFALSACAALSACSGGGGAKPEPGTFTVNLGVEPATLNPITSTDLYASTVQGYVLESLMSRNEDTYAWEPALAEKWEISPDGRQFTFTIREGVKWQDGKPLTIEDVKFSFDVIFDPKYPTAHIRPYYEGIEKVEVLDARRVRFTAKDRYFKNFDMAAGLTVVPKHIYGDSEKGPKNNKDLIGTGAYALEKYEKGKRIVLKQNPDWWGRKVELYREQANFKRVVLKFVKEPVVALEMLKKGEFDFDELTPEVYADKAVGPEWGTKVFKVKAENLSPKAYRYIGWNQARPLFQDVRVRHALSMLVNRPLLIQKFFYSMALPATGPWYQQSDYASPNAKPVPFDPEQASRLLAAAGWKDENKDGVLEKTIGGEVVPLRFTVVFANPDNQKYLTVYKEDAKKAGVDVELKQLEWNAMIKLVDERKYDAIMMGWGGGSVDVDPKQIWHSASAANGGSNFVGYKNPEVDRLIDEARQLHDKAQRLPKMRKIYDLIAADHPYAFLFNDQYVLYGHTPRVKRPKDVFRYSIGTGYWKVD
jgi:microcin C transport system substrate-binding protein